ncbi:MAG TPA: cytochrome c oxidase subunit 3 [Candidatus Acidoferrales bacterium]|nr:cytochrome c oxidase subunit 3 [Candidatus Acidoferrales bacterium]
MSELDATIHAGHAGMEESPYGIPSGKLAMWCFVLSDAVTFSAILFAYGYLRIGSTNWSTPFEFAHAILNGLVMTFILLTSGLTMLAAVEAAKAGRTAAGTRWLWATCALGALFATLHLREWGRMMNEGWRLFQNPLGGSVEFGAAFFCITGLHLLHVLGGVCALAVIALGYRRQRYNSIDVEVLGIYWHFVDLVWMFVFPLVYLMNAR